MNFSRDHDPGISRYENGASRLSLWIVCLMLASGSFASPVLEEAIRSCDSAAAVEAMKSSRVSDDAERVYDEGRVALLLGETSTAVEKLESAVQLDPSDSNYRLWFSRALFARAGELAVFRRPFVARKAIAELETALELDPANEDASVDQLLIHLRVPILGDGLKAAERISESLRRRGSDVAFLTRGMIAYENEKWGDAEREILRAAELLDDPRRALFWAGFLYQKLGRWEDAFRIHERLLRLSPHDPRVWYEYARTASFSGQNVDRGRAMVRRYIDATLPSGATSKEDARQLLEKLRDLPLTARPDRSR